eukprot:Nk52_evm41s152 gene=Nk52_evmTU41s152
MRRARNSLLGRLRVCCGGSVDSQRLETLNGLLLEVSLEIHRECSEGLPEGRKGGGGSLSELDDSRLDSLFGEYSLGVNQVKGMAFGDSLVDLQGFVECYNSYINSPNPAINGATLLMLVMRSNPFRAGSTCNRGVENTPTTIDFVSLLCEGPVDPRMGFILKTLKQRQSIFIPKRRFFFDLEVVDRQGRRALHDAVSYSLSECVTYFVTVGNARIDALKRGDWTPLMLACTKIESEVGNEESIIARKSILTTLIEAGADGDLVNKDGWNGLHLLSREGYLEFVEYYLLCFPDSWSNVSNNGRCPLHTAAAHGRKAVVDYLCSLYRSLVAMEDSCGETPLMKAASCTVHPDNIECFKSLLMFQAISGTVKEEISFDSALERDSDRQTTLNVLQHSDKCGRQALHISCMVGNSELSKLILDILIFCFVKGECSSTSRQTSQAVLQSFVLLMIDEEGKTPLHYAAYEGHGDCIDAFLKALIKLVLLKTKNPHEINSFHELCTMPLKALGTLDSQSLESFCNALRDCHERAPQDYISIKGHSIDLAAKLALILNG